MAIEVSDSDLLDPNYWLRQLLRNGDWETTGSVSSAKDYVIAGQNYIALAPTSQSDQGASMTISVSQIERMVQRAQTFITTSAGGVNSGVKFLGVDSNFR